MIRLLHHNTAHAFSFPSSRRRGFSLIEVLLAIFILGVGVISIAALFPAGIVQQRQSVDDVIGPIVAQNAMAVLRGKLKPDDFGYWYQTFPPGHPTLQGDFPWSRPAFIFGATPEQSGISIFRDADTVTEVRRNTVKYPTPASIPNIRFTQGERYYPMAAIVPGPDGTMGTADDRFDDQAARPQYVWDCMFRRFQGKILVAIFVYRASIPGGGPAAFSVPRNLNGQFATVPPMPIYLNLTQNGFPMWDSDKAPSPAPNCGSSTAPIQGTAAGVHYNPSIANQAWQEPRQWILDYNNNIHRVVGSWRDNDDVDNRVEVELMRPVAPYPQLRQTGSSVNNAFPQRSPFFYPPGSNGSTLRLVRDIWYVPVTVDYDLDGDGSSDGQYSLTPVYVTVKEL